MKKNFKMLLYMNKKIFEKLNIDNFLTSGFKKTNIQNKIKNNTALFEHFNYMADLLFLPTTKEGLSPQNI